MRRKGMRLVLGGLAALGDRGAAALALVHSRWRGRR